MRRLSAFLATAVLAGAAGVVAITALSDDSTPIRVAATEFQVRGEGESAAIAATTTTVVVPAHTFLAGEAKVPLLEAYAMPAPPPGTAPAVTASNPTHEGFPLVVSVIEQSPDGAWLEVRLPQRPNGTTGWVRTADLRLWEVPNRIEVAISSRTLRVYAGDTTQILFESVVSVGAPGTPTPEGDFFIDIVNPLGNHRTYGWGQLSVAGFSEVLERFAGGIGQIAIHGWNDPSDMGRNVSNGCVRMNNDDIARVAELAPLGTPVTVVA